MKRIQCALGTLALLFCFTWSLSAQQNTPSQPTDPTAQQPAQPPQGQGQEQGSSSQAPDSRSTPGGAQQAAPASDSQTFTGTIVKAGDKYVLQDTASGSTYDIDHQEQLKQYEGKKVRVHGTLDPSGKMIHLQ